MHSNESDFPTL